jgi:hypothetical protein|tara:strand:- start:6586 stop:6732 length:147 start_codon:yes stop_codon:yes gene_type:complete
MILVFVTLLFMPLTEPNVEKTTVEALNQQKIKYIKIPTPWIKVAKKPI